MSPEDENVIEWLGWVLMTMGATLMFWFAVLLLYAAVDDGDQPVHMRAFVAFMAFGLGLLTTRAFHMSVRGPA